MDPEILKYHGDENKSSFTSHIVDFIQTLVVFGAIGTAIYLFVAQPHKVSGSSMFPNFHDGDYIITDKVSYRFGDPKRGDVVVFKNPKDDSQEFIKRIMAVPGDKIRVEDGRLYLNDKLINEPYLKSTVVTNPGAYMQEGQDVTVTPGHFITIGDNRPNSSDSREWGLVIKDKIIGRVFLRYWPQNAIGFNPAAYSIDNDLQKTAK